VRKPSHPALNPQHSRAQLLERAAMALRMRQFADAEQLAAEALKANRTDNVAISMLANALLAQGRGREAIPLLEKAARRGGDAAIETLLGAALASAGRRADAIAQLRITAARQPLYPPAAQELAGQLSQAGEPDAAIAALHSAAALRPDLIELQLDLARLNLNANRRDAARAILVAARDATPGRPDVHAMLGRVLLLVGDYAGAEAAFRHALGLAPDDAMLRADLAACLLEMGQRDAGEAALRTAMRGRPQMLGRAVYALGMSSHGRLFLRPSQAAKFLQR
jgi:tetratricopeptide (TPR) repeat protein